MAFRDLFRDRPAQTEMVSMLNPQQQALQGQAIGRAGNLLQNVPQSVGQNQFNFAPIEQKAREGFLTKTVPSLAERFIGSGSGPRSSAFQGALGSAGADLETNLAALGAEYGFRANEQNAQNSFRAQELQQGQLNQLLHYGLQPSQNQLYTPAQSSPAKRFIGGLVGTALPAATNLGLSALMGRLGGQAAGAGLSAGLGALTGGGTPIAPAASVGGSAAQAAGPAGGWLASRGIDPTTLATAYNIAGPLASGAAIVSYIINANEQGRQEEAAEAAQKLAEHEEFLKNNPDFGQVPPNWPQPIPGEGFFNYMKKVLPVIQADRLAREQAAGGQ